MRILVLSLFGFMTSGCGLFRGLERDSAEITIIDTGETVDTGGTVDTDETVDTGATGDTGEAPNDIEPKSGDYNFVSNGESFDDCQMFEGMPEPGTEAFEGNANVHLAGVVWVIGESEIETQWVGDYQFSGPILEYSSSQDVEGLSATYVVEAVWFGEWSTDLELSATVEFTILCIGPDCEEVEDLYAQNNGVILPCVSHYGVDGALGR